MGFTDMLGGIGNGTFDSLSGRYTSTTIRCTFHGTNASHVTGLAIHKPTESKFSTYIAGIDRRSSLISAMDASRASKSAARATMDACLAQYGWRD